MCSSKAVKHRNEIYISTQLKLVQAGADPGITKGGACEDSLTRHSGKATVMAACRRGVKAGAIRIF